MDQDRNLRGWSAVKVKVVETEENAREGRISGMRKEVTIFVQAVVGKKKLLVQLEIGKRNR